jgi:hypothetical protein
MKRWRQLGAALAFQAWHAYAKEEASHSRKMRKIAARWTKGAMLLAWDEWKAGVYYVLYI